MNLEQHRRDVRGIVLAKIDALAENKTVVIGEQSHHPARLLQEDRMERLYFWLSQLVDEK